ncbi:MAG: O-antigen ligase family protein [Candidatus Komeilibacteria bacterium]|nr:O-antigen ligase family protein [Candidatus Komeilibacteria bacterium]
MNQKTLYLVEKILKNIVIFGSFLVVLLPIVIVPGSYFPYIIQKTNILKILIELIFLAYLPLALWKAEYRPKKSFILWAVLAFAGIMILTTFTSQSVYRSWWGNWERSFGTFNYLHYFAWFIALLGVFKEKKYWYYLLNFSLIVSALIGLYAVAQRMDLGITFESGLQRVNATMGNASFLSAYMLMHVFIALLFITEKVSLKLKFWYWSVFILDFLVLQLTATRGGLLGLAGALVLFIILVFTLKLWEKKSVKILVGLTLFVFLIGGLAMVFKESPLIKGNYWLRRLTSFSINDGTVQTRLRTWTWGLQGFRDNFIFGLGPENYHIAFNQYFEPDFYRYSATEIWFDRAHNNLVDMASTMGIFGLLSYLGILWAVFHALTMLYRQQKISKLAFVVIILLFFSYTVQNLAVFDSLNTLIIFYLLLAYVAFLYTSNNVGPVQEGDLAGRVRISPLVSLPVLTLLFLLLFFAVDLKQIKENLYVYNAYIAGKLGNYAESMYWYDKTYNDGLHKIDPAILRSSSIGELVESNKENASKEWILEDLNKAIDWMDKAIALDQRNMFLYYLQAKNYALAAELSGDAKYLDKGLAMADKAQELRPGEIRPYWLKAQIYLFGSQPEKALEYLNQANELYDRLPETYFYLSVVYQSMGNEEKYREVVEEMLDRGFSFFSADLVKKTIPYYDAQGDIKRLIQLYDELTRLESNNANYWQDYVDLLVQDKQYDRALLVLQKAAEKIPAFSSRAYTRYQEIIKLKDGLEGAATSTNQ